MIFGNLTGRVVGIVVAVAPAPPTIEAMLWSKAAYGANGLYYRVIPAL